ncbi:MAG: hypothetical protein EHM42_12335, partial [Planctomycetaceae bacterium]
MTTPANPQDANSNPVSANNAGQVLETQPGEVGEPTSMPAVQPPLEEYEELTPELVEDEAIRGDFVIRWAVVLLAFLLASTKVGDASTLVQIKTGQYLASHGFLPPRNDVFSATATDRLWPNLSWGFDLILGSVYSLAGFVGISAFKALVVAITFALVASISRRGLPTWWTSICATLALLACHMRLTAQPTIVTLLGLATVFFLLHRFREERSNDLPDAQPQQTRSLWALGLVFVVWCNLDSRAFLGLSCLLLYTVGETLAATFKTRSALAPGKVRHLWIVTAICAAAML